MRLCRLIPAPRGPLDLASQVHAAPIRHSSAGPWDTAALRKENRGFVTRFALCLEVAIGIDPVVQRSALENGVLQWGCGCISVDYHGINTAMGGLFCQG